MSHSMLNGIATSLFGLALTFFAALPATSNYQLNSYGFGSGGTANSTTANYALEGTTGELSGQTASTANYNTKPGFIETQQSNVPKITLTNPSSYYDKLNFVIDTQGNPTDAKYALQVSTVSDFSSNIKYVKTDLTLGATLTTADYQTYTTWGGGSGNNIIGLSPSTTYYIRAKATHVTTFNGISTESGYGPSSNAATGGASLSFCLYGGVNCAAAGNSVAFGSVLPATVTNSPNNIGVDFATNADSGGKVYIYSVNGGLHTTLASYTITSATADLSSASEGFGAQIASIGQSSGGPFTKVSPYDLASNNVGIVGTTVKEILTSSNPITGGTAAIQLKVKPGNTAPTASDYSETLTVIAAAAF